MKTYLAIDIGASSGRHIVAWLEGGKIETREVYRFPNGGEMKNGHFCWDIEALEKHVVAGLKAAKDAGYEPAYIGIDTWGVDFVLLDKEGRRVGEAVAYRDSRTDGMDAELEKVMPFPFHFGLCGIAKQPFNTVYQMMAVVRERPKYAEQVDDFLMMPEYLSYMLTGKKAHEWTNCTTGALCNAESGTWSETIRAAAGLPEKWFRTPMVKPCVESKVFGIGVEAYTVGSAEYALAYAAMNPGKCIPLMDNGHYHPTEVVSDKIPALLAFFPELALHITRPIRWDSDHVVLLDDETKEIAKEIVRCGGLDGKVHMALDYFDASINRVSAWVVGFRNVQKALQMALLTPACCHKAMQDKDDWTALMVAQEEMKTLPFGEIWNEYCRRCGKPEDGQWFDKVRKYEREVLLKRV